MSETKVALLRHGQTDWNIDFRLQGTTDIPLNDHGRAQAKAVGQLIRASDWDLILTSPLSRAIETSQIVSDSTGIRAVRVEALLLERAFGEAEGMTYEEWKSKFSNYAELPGGESLEQLAVRSWQLLDFLAAEFSGKRVLAVTHGSLIRKIIKLVSDGEYPREHERLGNASISTITHSAGAWSIGRYYPATYEGWEI